MGPEAVRTLPLEGGGTGVGVMVAANAIVAYLCITLPLTPSPLGRGS